MKLVKDNIKPITIGASIVVLGAMIPQLNDLARFWASHEVAYAAQEQVKGVQQYIDRLDAYIEAQQQYQQQMQYPSYYGERQSRRPPQIREADEYGVLWCCDERSEEDCWHYASWYQCS